METRRPEFTEEQIIYLEDKIMNLLVYPTIIIDDAIKTGTVKVKKLEKSYEQLFKIAKTIRNLRKVGYKIDNL